MQLARVIGTVVATVKNDSLEGRKLLVVQSLNADLEPQGKPLVALDAIGAGTGELVFWCRGKEASFPFARRHADRLHDHRHRRFGGARDKREGASEMILARVLGNVVATQKNQRYAECARHAVPADYARRRRDWHDRAGAGFG